jgi:hypothetical protein
MTKRNGTVNAGLIIGLSILGAVLLLSLSFYGYVNGLRTQGVQTEAALTAQYLSNQNYLSSYVSGFYEQLGIVKYKSEKLDAILLDYAKGRSFGGEAKSGGFINAVHEAVPDLAGLNIADRMMDYVAGGRAGYRATQDKLNDMLRAYDAWRNDGFVQSGIVSGILHIPSERLEARVGSEVLHGPDARNKMFQIVLASDAKQAYTTGVMEPLKVQQ